MNNSLEITKKKPLKKSLFYRIVKRSIDVFCSLIALVLLSPVFLVTVICIAIEDGRPFVYKQKRVGKDKKVFEIYKFRSMRKDADKIHEQLKKHYGSNDVSFKLEDKDDPRITKVGRVIRAIRIDELPQIINILKGDMSIVGPRPERIEHVRMYAEAIPEFRYRYKVRGGLTGYAQIYGKYNTSPYDKIRLDLMYIEHYSIWLDIKLILLTLRILFQKESTEGFDAAEENQRKTEAMLKDIRQQEEKK